MGSSSAASSKKTDKIGELRLHASDAGIAEQVTA